MYKGGSLAIRKPPVWALNTLHLLKNVHGQLSELQPDLLYCYSLEGSGFFPFFPKSTDKFKILQTQVAVSDYRWLLTNSQWASVCNLRDLRSPFLLI